MRQRNWSPVLRSTLLTSTCISVAALVLLTRQSAWAQTITTFVQDAYSDSSMNPIVQHVYVQPKMPAKVLTCAFHDTQAWTKGEQHTLSTHGDLSVGFATGVTSVQYVVFGFKNGDTAQPLVASIGQLQRDNGASTYFDSTGHFVFNSRTDSELDLQWSVASRVGDPSRAAVFVCGVLRASGKGGKAWRDASLAALYHATSYGR